MVLWYWEELWEATRSSKGSEGDRELLRGFLEYISNLEPQGVKLAETISTATKVCVNDLWQLFRPGTWVLSKSYLDEPQVFRVKDIYHRENKENFRSYYNRNGGMEQYKFSFVVLAWAFGWRGTELVQEHYEFLMGYENSTDEKIITDLPCYPIEYHKDGEGHHGSPIVAALEQQLVERGQLFEKLCEKSLNTKHQNYHGELLYYDLGRYEYVPRESWDVSHHAYRCKFIFHECYVRKQCLKLCLKSEQYEIQMVRGFSTADKSAGEREYYD